MGVMLYDSLELQLIPALHL